MKTKTVRSPKSSSVEEMIETALPPSETELRALIATRAYEIYQMRLGLGDELSDWLAAEHEVLALYSARTVTANNVVPLATVKEKRTRTAKLAVVSKPRKQTTKKTSSQKSGEKTE